MSQKLRVLHIASWYPNEISPQNGNFIQRHIAAISELTESYLLHTFSSNTQEIQISQKNENGFASCLVSYPKSAGWQRYFQSVNAFETGFQVLKTKAGDFDIIHLHVMMPGIVFARKIAKRLQLPLIVTEHATAFQSSHPQRYSGWKKLMLQYYSRSVRICSPVSNDLMINMKTLGIKTKFQVIDNVVDTRIFKPVEKRNSQKFQFLHVSTLYDPHKNVTGLLRSFKNLLEKREDVYLTIIGNGFHEEHRKTICQLGLSEFASVFEEMEIDEIAHQMQQASTLVLFSNFENAPCVISEAHCCGIPVISTNVGGISEMIDDSNGILIKAKNEDDLSQAMFEMINNRHKFDMELIAKKAQERYSYSAIGHLYYALYKEVINELEN